MSFRPRARAEMTGLSSSDERGPRGPQPTGKSSSSSSHGAGGGPRSPVENPKEGPRSESVSLLRRPSSKTQLRSARGADKNLRAQSAQPRAHPSRRNGSKTSESSSSSGERSASRGGPFSRDGPPRTGARNGAETNKMNRAAEDITLAGGQTFDEQEQYAIRSLHDDLEQTECAIREEIEHNIYLRNARLRAQQAAGSSSSSTMQLPGDRTNNAATVADEVPALVSPTAGAMLVSSQPASSALSSARSVPRSPVPDMTPVSTAIVNINKAIEGSHRKFGSVVEGLDAAGGR